MELRKVSGCDKGDCAAVYISDQGTGVVQGTPVLEAEGLSLGAGEIAVELPLELLWDAYRTLQLEGKL